MIPYYRPKLDSYEKEYHARFDDVIVPALEDVPYQYRIVRANEYMVDRAETVIAYVNTPIGGAAKTLAYALWQSHSPLSVSAFTLRSWFRLALTFVRLDLSGIPCDGFMISVN